MPLACLKVVYPLTFPHKGYCSITQILLRSSIRDSSSSWSEIRTCGIKFCPYMHTTEEVHNLIDLQDNIAMILAGYLFRTIFIH